MQDEPSARLLLDAVIAFLRDVAIPALPAREAFVARVAANAVELVAREIDVAPGAQIAESRRLEALLGHAGDLRTLTEEFSERLSTGTLDASSPDVASHLWMTTMEKLAVDQPSYSAYRAALEERSSPSYLE